MNTRTKTDHRRAEDDTYRMTPPHPDLLHYDLGEGVQAFSTRRGGGCSRGAYAGFNVNPYCGDDAACVAANRRALCRMLAVEEERLLLPHQTHDTRTLFIDEDFFALTAGERQQRMEGVDALVTCLPHTCVAVSTADCIPVLLFDAASRAVAAIHAGWRGTAGHIVSLTLARMQERLGTDPAEVRAVIGPGISAEAFEVGDEVYEAFQAAGFAMDDIARRYPARDGGRAMKWHIDLWEANRRQLVQGGVRPTRIQVSGVCTFGHPDAFFSARRLGIRSGRILNGILLTSS